MGRTHIAKMPRLCRNTGTGLLMLCIALYKTIACRQAAKSSANAYIRKIRPDKIDPRRGCG